MPVCAPAIGVTTTTGGAATTTGGATTTSRPANPRSTTGIGRGGGTMAASAFGAPMLPVNRPLSAPEAGVGAGLGVVMEA